MSMLDEHVVINTFAVFLNPLILRTLSARKIKGLETRQSCGS